MTLFDRIWERKNRFLLVFFVIYVLSYGLLVAIDFVPEAPESVPGEANAPAVVATTHAPVAMAEEKPSAPLPERVVIPELDIDVAVLNPQSTSVAVLDAELLKGVVRHPESADFSQKGTMFLFGHSSYLPIVHNKNFQAFNGIQKLEKGDEIRVHSSDTEYVYQVTRVTKVAASETEVALQNDKDRLILVTCNSFGSKDDRFMVEAELVEKHPQEQFSAPS